MNYPSQDGQDQYENDSEEQHRVLAQEKSRLVSTNKVFLVMRVQHSTWTESRSVSKCERANQFRGDEFGCAKVGGFLCQR